MYANPGGHVLSASDMTESGVACEHLFPGLTRDVGGVLRTNLNGALARRNPLLGYDGVLLRSNRKAYIGETIMVALSSERIVWTNQTPCHTVSPLSRLPAASPRVPSAENGWVGTVRQKNEHKGK